MRGSPFAVVNAPRPEQPSLGLLAAVAGTQYDIVGDTEVVDGIAEPQRWTLGFAYLPYPCAGNGGIVDPDACAHESKPIDANQPVVEFEPFGVWQGQKCSTFGWSQAQYEERAAALLAAFESKYIAAELWTGAKAQAKSWPNAYLASPASDTVTNGPVATTMALECLEESLADLAGGQRGMIHCTRQLASVWSELGNTFRSVNGLVLTYNNNIIVADAGYDGSGPNGQPAVDGSQWAYATTMVTVRRSSVTTVPKTLVGLSMSEQMGAYGEAVSRDTNEVEFRAERLAAATFSPCSLLAVEVDLPFCLIGGAS